MGLNCHRVIGYFWPPAMACSGVPNDGQRVELVLFLICFRDDALYFQSVVPSCCVIIKSYLDFIAIERESKSCYGSVDISMLYSYNSHYLAYLD